MLGDAGEHVGEPGLGIDVVHLGRVDQACTWPRRARRRGRSRRTASSCVRAQSRSHSAHIGQDVVVHYRWHPLHGRSARRIQSERRASGEFVHVELTPGVVTILPAWKLDAVYCAGLKVGAPQVSLAALCDTARAAGRLRIAAGLRGRQHRHAGGAGWNRCYRSHEGRSLLRGTPQAPAAPRQLDLVLDDARLRGMTPAERQAVLIASLARLLLEASGSRNAGGRR